MAKLQPRAVRCVETGDVYQSSGAAGRAFGIDPSGILKCCKGLANTAAGHTWVFADEDVPEDQDVTEDQDELDENESDGYDESDEDDDYGEEKEDDRTVADFMKTSFAAVKITDTLAVAEHIMLEGGYLRLPVVDENGKLVGIVTQYDIKKKAAELAEFTESKFLNPSLPIEKFVVREVVMTTPDEPASEIARAYEDFNAKFLPVVASEYDKTLVGVVTYFDYLNR